MRILAMSVAATIAFAAPAQAREIRPFSNAAFVDSQKHNTPVVIFVHAPWCPICRAQEQTIKAQLQSPRFKSVTVLTIDYDTQKPIWSKFGVTRQSTLIGFHGRRETSRLSYDSDPEKVTAVLASTLR